MSWNSGTCQGCLDGNFLQHDRGCFTVWPPSRPSPCPSSDWSLLPTPHASPPLVLHFVMPAGHWHCCATGCHAVFPSIQKSTFWAVPRQDRTTEPAEQESCPCDTLGKPCTPHSTLLGYSLPGTVLTTEVHCKTGCFALLPDTGFVTQSGLVLNWHSSCLGLPHTRITGGPPHLAFFHSWLLMFLGCYLNGIWLSESNTVSKFYIICKWFSIFCLSKLLTLRSRVQRIRTKVTVKGKQGWV